jgi:hypothetical protein
MKVGRQENIPFQIEGDRNANFQSRVQLLCELTMMEAIVKKFLLAAALTAAVVTGASAQTYYDPSPRDPPFGKGNPGNDTYHLPNQTDLGWGASSGNVTYGDPWREPRYRRPQTDRQ